MEKSSPHSQWQTEPLAETYLKGVRVAIPAAALQLDIIQKIVTSWCPRLKNILDLGCGDGPLGRLLLKKFPSATVTLVDFSDPMLEAARNRLDDPKRAYIVKADFSSRKWLEPISDQAPFDVVVSGFAIHHQPDHRKQQLYKEIYQLLTDRGVFLNLEHVSSSTPAVEALFNSFFVDHLFSFHRRLNPNVKRNEIEKTYYNRPDKKENILAPVEKQCEWLRRIGFHDVDCYFRVFELALFGGRKKMS
jgi:ubiquinone/menaquinone biosynthesis C-methylase UbiE